MLINYYLIFSIYHLQQPPNPYSQVLVEEGEKHHCDTLGAMLKSLKNKKVIEFNQMFLMYPMHKDEIVTLKRENFDPFNDE